MAFPASTLRLSQALDQVVGTMSNTKSYATARRAAMVAGNVPANDVLDIWEHLASVKTRLQTLGAINGIAAYAQGQFADENLNLATEFNAVIAAIDAVRAHVQSVFPASEGWLLARSFGSGVFTERKFSPAQTATLQTLLATLAATIN